jgi:hypothetical protein
MLNDEAIPPREAHQLGIVVDANVFGRRAWIEALIDASTAGHVRLYWSPTIVEEMARFRQLLWIRNWMRGGGVRLTDSVARRFSEEAHRWMDFVSPHFHVVEDKPPHSPAWADPIPDPYDAPIWTAARRAGAEIIVTQNLKDGPPADDHGVRAFEDVIYLDPNELCEILDLWGDLVESRRVSGATRDETVGDNSALGPLSGSVDSGGLAPAIRDFLLDIERRRGGELPPPVRE